MKNYLLLILLLSSFFGIAQLQLKGVVKNGDEPVVYANVILTDNKGELIGNTGGITNEDGLFNINTKAGEYKLIISYIGFTNWEKEIALTSNIDLGVISLKATAESLDEVVIIAEEKLIEQKTDRLIFNVESSIAAKGGNAVDVLNVTPGIRIQNDNISMIGGESSRIMIDGRLIQLTGEDLINFLNSIVSDDIKKIEIITNPPAKYDAEGNGGIINIIYKKGRRNSWKNTSSIVHNQNTYNFYTLRNSFFYNKNRMRLVVSGNRSKGNIRNQENSDVLFPDNLWKVETESKDEKDNFSGRLSVEYDISEKTKIGGQYLGNFDRPDSRGNGITRFINNTNSLDSLLINDSNRRDEINSQVFNAHLITKLDTIGRKVSLDFDYFDYSNSLENDYVVNTFSPNNEFIRINQAAQNFSKQDIDNYSLKLDVEHPFKSFNLTYGGKISFITTLNNLQNFNTISGTPVLDTNLSNEFEYKENVQAFYLNGTKRINDKLNLQAGLRVENTQTTGYSKTLDQRNENDYLKLFPRFYISYQKNDNHNFSFNYGRGINRPGFRDLNPFRSFINSNAYSEGNPFIQPSFTDRFTLAHNYKGKLITNIYLSRTIDGFGTLFSADPDNDIQAIIRRNYYTGSFLRISEIYNFSPTHWWKSQNYFSFARQHTKLDDDLNSSAQNGNQFYFSTNNTFVLGENTKLQANFWYNSKHKALLFKVNETYSFNIGLQQSFLNKNLQMSLLFNDIFDTASLSSLESEINGVKTIYGQNYSSRHIRFSLTYSFGNKKINLKNRGFGNDDERNRAN
ncbi:TonB-dependent receptor domain-containing protein [Aquimarina sp. 2201CG5-10]|uniref:TonB-dependent receptor domain-containing protein n=1 Tax=Aquimarina callyspongiae TaxID=3098150 RepID=UPI002AB39420|nr:TonB-dependent receptor [Aquimarina sp. 2201CG5-10]MDY8135910.1 TonB-dependent receptor [Aquimarina sp. 2201CG5-10]